MDRTDDGRDGRDGRAEPEPRTLSHRELRRIAEAASGIRGEKFWMVIDDEGWRLERKRPAPKPGQVVVPCRNPPTAERPAVAVARIGSSESGAVDLLRLRVGEEEVAADAVFWSASAVEKFLVPYYASVHGNQADRKVAEILDVLDDEREPPPEGNGALRAFGLAHIPKSDYIVIGDEEGDDLAVLVRRGKEDVALPLSRFRAERAAGPG